MRYSSPLVLLATLFCSAAVAESPLSPAPTAAAATPAPVATTVEDKVDVIGERLVADADALERLPGSYDRVDLFDLQSSQVTQFNEALRKVPGLFARDEEGLALRPNIGLRGINPTRSTKILLLEDGVFLTFAPYGDNASYYHPPIERFAGIEVVKGAGQIAFGPATTGGVINYLTPDPPHDRLLTFRLDGGNRAYRSGQMAFGNELELFSFRLDLLHKEGDGARENVHSAVEDVAAKLLYELDERRTWSTKASFYREDSTVTYSGLTLAEFQANPRQNPFENDKFDGKRAGLSSKFSWLVNSSFDSSTQIYASAFDRDWWRQSSNSGQRPNDRNDPACGGMANLLTTCGNEGRLREYRQFGFDQRGRFSFQLGESFLESEAGLRWHHEDQERRQENGASPRARTGVLVENNRRESTAASGFVSNRLILDHFTLSVGVRFESIDHERENRLANAGLGAEGDLRIDEWVPGFGLTYSPNSRLTLFAGAHRGFAPPRVEDVISQTGGVIDLDAEESWIYELGVRSQPRSGIELSSSLFRTDYTNQIVPSSLAGGVGSTLTNGGATLHEGIEGSLRVDSRALVGTRYNVFGRLAFTYLPTARFEGDRFSSVTGFSQVRITGNRLPYAPETLWTAAMGAELPRGITFQVEAVHTSEQFGDDLNTISLSADGQRGLLPAATIWNASVAFDLPWLEANFHLTAKNLTDKLTIADRSRGILPGPPRQVLAGISLQF